MRKKILSFLLISSLMVSMTGCQIGKTGKETALDPKKPVTVTVWNYYNGDQLNTFNELIDEFNSTVGKKKGITVVGVGQSDIDTLANSLVDAVDQKAGAPEKPVLAAVYSETAYKLKEKNAIVDLDSYFSKKELSAYIDAFIDEGRFDEKDRLLSFPISKSTELFTVNETDWKPFAKATGIQIKDITTQESLVKAAKAYYEYTDALTPNVKEDGKALYGRDSLGNYIYVGCAELGHEVYTIKDGKVTVDMDRDTFKTLWDNYYIPFINGYFGGTSNYRSEDIKTGKIIALTSAFSSMGYLPSEVVTSNEDTHSIKLKIQSGLHFENANEPKDVQQGANFCMLKSGKAKQEGAAEFLKWFTKANRNMEFSVNSGYSPVTKKANDTKKIEKVFEQKKEADKNILTALEISADVFKNGNGYAIKPCGGSKEVRTILSDALKEIAVRDRQAVVAAIKKGKTRQQAVAPYSTDTYFDTWFNELKQQVEKQIPTDK